MKSVIFNIIGNKKNGTGHIYRSLSLAKEIVPKYKVIFVTNKSEKLAIIKLKKTNYKIILYPKKNIFQKIAIFKPNVVINDVLSTKKSEIKILKKNRIKVINFEDLGKGAELSDLTINEIFEKPKTSNNKIIWGKNYFFIRDEFVRIQKNNYQNIKNILLFFGGSDPNNLTLKILKSIYEISIEKNINIKIITGIGYKNKQSLLNYLKFKKNISLIKNTSKISIHMKKCQFAFTSNGRTTYELAHMNIPAIVISHNDRESMHKFSSFRNGFINLGQYNKKEFSFNKVITEFKSLINDQKLYKKLYKSMLPINFNFARREVKKKINKIEKIF